MGALNKDEASYNDEEEQKTKIDKNAAIASGKRFFRGQGLECHVRVGVFDLYIVC